MALREFYLGTVGPFYYDDTDTYDDDPAIHHCALRTPQQLYIGTAPVGDKQVVRLEDLVTALIGYIEKALLTEKGDIIYASAVATPAALAHGNAGDVLTSGGHGVDPSWQASSAAWDGDIADINLDGGTDIGADLTDADLILVDDGGGGTNRKCAMSRLKSYIGVGLAIFFTIRTPIDLAIESTTISNMMTTSVSAADV